MALPDGYFYRQGYYWKVDGTGPYQWNGATMDLLTLGVTQDTFDGMAGPSAFDRQGVGPVTDDEA